MANNFTSEFECNECFTTGTRQEANGCHGAARKVYICEVCLTSYDEVSAAQGCCIRKFKNGAPPRNIGAMPGAPAEKKEDRPTAPPKPRDPVDSNEKPKDAVPAQASKDAAKNTRNGGIARFRAPKVPAAPTPAPEPRLSRTIPVPDCPICGIAQKLGRVVYCACMK